MSKWISLYKVSCPQSFKKFLIDFKAVSKNIDINKMEWDNSLGDCVTEKNVGIIAYANTADGFQAIHKQRFTDFIVREVCKNEISSLNSIDYGDFETKLFEPPAPKLNAVKTMEPHIIITEIEKEIKEFLIINHLDQTEHNIQIDIPTNHYLLQCIEKREDCPDSYNAFPCSNKLLRTKLHEIIRKYLSSVIDSDTIPINGITYFRLNAKHKRQKGVYNRNSNNSSSSSSSSSNRSMWPKTLGDYLKFTLLKENVDTMSACNILAKSLFLRNTTISYAGTKDKRAVTSQNCTIYRKKPSDFKRINSSTYSPFIRVGNFEYVQEPITLGALDSNQFTIVLRGINVNTSIIEKACIALNTSGFINYFGLQRFGKGGSSSNEIGISLLKGDWKVAVEKLFLERFNDREEIKIAKKYFKEKDYISSKLYLPKQMISERNVLEHLSLYPIDYAGALNKIHKHTRLLCVHAYQSYLFNLGASYRLKLFGTQIVEGDLVVLNPTALALDDAATAGVLDEDEGEGEEELIGDDELLQQEKSQGSEGGIINSNGSNNSNDNTNSSSNGGSNSNNHNDSNDNTKVEEINESSSSSSSSDINTHDTVPLRKHIINIHIVTKEDIDNNRYTINDIVLPLVGCDTIFPSNIGTFFQDILTHEKLTLESFSKCEFLYRSRGSYRKVLEHPKKFKWSIQRYNDMNEDIMVTEVSKFKGKGKYMFNQTATTTTTTGGAITTTTAGDTAAIATATTAGDTDTSATTIAAAGDASTGGDGDTSPPPPLPLPIINNTSITSSTEKEEEDKSNNNNNNNDSHTTTTTTDIITIRDEDKAYTALILEFELHPGTYATMLLRELSKHSTESLYQAHLTANTKQSELDRNNSLIVMGNSSSNSNSNDSNSNNNDGSNSNSNDSDNNNNDSYSSSSNDSNSGINNNNNNNNNTSTTNSVVIESSPNEKTKKTEKSKNSDNEIVAVVGISKKPKLA